MSKFFINEICTSNTIDITGEDAAHIALVLRAKVGDHLTVCDLSSTDYECEIEAIAKKNITLKVLNSHPNENEPSYKITLYQALPKGDKMDMVIQKCVEIGVDTIVPVLTENTVVKIKDKEDKKLARFNKIAEAAAKQCGRGKIPTVEKIVTFKEAIEQAKALDGVIIPYEKEEQTNIKSFTTGFKGTTIGVFIGPEGGFSPTEIDQAIQAGVSKITLGKRILRTETAGLVTLVILLHELEG